ncbi:MAG: class I SAM-dependent methyltransferase [Lachnospiraceae bacterium]|nr:class I SAM-dependent methyltransferase [Lachnospiraceae bacterium]
MLSERLSAVAGLTESAARELRGQKGTESICITDIGTDHGYLPIWLITHEVADRVIAADVNRGPLARAEAHVIAAGLTERIDVRLSDGFSGIRQGEAQIAVLSGMGGRLMVRLLTECPPQELGIRQLVLQPQSEPKELWEFLRENGWFVVDEQMVYEDDQFYTMMRAVRAGANVRKSEDDFGAFLSARRDETWHLLLEKERAANSELIEKLTAGNAPEARIAELRAQQANIDAALTVFREDAPDGDGLEGS